MNIQQHEERPRKKKRSKALRRHCDRKIITERARTRGKVTLYKDITEKNIEDGKVRGGRGKCVQYIKREREYRRKGGKTVRERKKEL